jgi:hypothetical protein
VVLPPDLRPPSLQPAYGGLPLPPKWGKNFRTAFVKAPSFVEEKYDIIYADPPRDYNGKMQFDKSNAGKEKLDLSRNIFISSAEFKYPTMNFNWYIAKTKAVLILY